jgi:hypothetical protein
MRYSVESTSTGYVETLEVDGKEYHKRWKRTVTGARCESREFWEQLQEDGENDEDALDKICEEIDNSFFASNIDGVYMNTPFV